MIDKVLSPEIINRYSGYYFKVERSALNKLDKAYFENKYGKSTSIIKEDWDNLVLLDACRYDTFSNRNFLQGDLKKRVSNASTSTEFIKNNFCGENLHDTVYITANPYVSMIDSDVFHGVITLFDKWDMEKQTIMPGSVVDSVAEINDLYPNKKLIVHFMQPHQPYIGEKGEQIRSKIKDEVGLWGWNNPSYDTKGEKISMWTIKTFGKHTLRALTLYLERLIR